LTKKVKGFLPESFDKALRQRQAGAAGAIRADVTPVTGVAR